MSAYPYDRRHSRHDHPDADSEGVSEVSRSLFREYVEIDFLHDNDTGSTINTARWTTMMRRSSRCYAHPRRASLTRRISPAATGTDADERANAAKDPHAP